MLPKLILCESSLRKDQKTYFNHSHISNIRGVTIKNIWDHSDRYGTIPTAMGPTSLPKRDRIVGIIAPGDWEKVYVGQSRDTKNNKRKRSTGICRER